MLSFTVKQVKEIIRQEAQNWTKYDMAIDKERSHMDDQLAASDALVNLSNKGKRSKRKSRPPAQFTELGPFVTGTTKRPKSQSKSAKSKPKRTTKRRLDFPKSVTPASKKGKKAKQAPTGAATGPATGPADPAGATDVAPTGPPKSAAKDRQVAAKDVSKILWAQHKLVNQQSLHAQVAKKPTKIASLMFDVLPKADVAAMATQMCKHCSVDCLEEVLEKYRKPTLQILAQRLNDNLQHIKELDAVLANDEVLAKDDVVLAKDDVVPSVDDGRQDDGPKDEGAEDDDGAKDGPKEAGPKEDGSKEAEPIETPDPSHWIRSQNTSSGFKGVNKCRGRKGKVWRAKCAGTTIGRYETKAEACQAYYEYCKANGKLQNQKKKEQVRDVIEWAS